MRLLGSNADVNYQLADMGFLPETLKTLRSLMKFSNGIILCTGPTGSGKTTTLYSMLKEIIDPKTNIVTVEDPVEKRMIGINQVQVNNRAGLTFANGLRSILRQDPDVILIGEIRDPETADIAIRASITGHLVLSTLHTNDSFSSIARLADMGIENYLLADSIRGIIAQRLVKKLCPKCKEIYAVTKEEKLRLKDQSLTMAYKPKGCPFCNNTGYKGRIAVNEILTMTSELRRLVINPNTDIETLRDYGKKIDMRMMKNDLIVLINSGVTSVEEAVKIVYSVE
jgi:type IV pilus assembly protein PilB